MCMPRLPEVLGQPTAPELVEHLADGRGDAPGLREPGARLGVEVDAQLVRALGVGPPGVPGVELDRGHLHGPDHIRQLGTHSSSAVRPDGKRHLDRLQPVGRALGHAASGRSSRRRCRREAVQHARPLVQRPDDALADGDVVVGQVELGPAERRRSRPGPGWRSGRSGPRPPIPPTATPCRNATRCGARPAGRRDAPIGHRLATTRSPTVHAWSMTERPEDVKNGPCVHRCRALPRSPQPSCSPPGSPP